LHRLKAVRNKMRVPFVGMMVIELFESSEGVYAMIVDAHVLDNEGSDRDGTRVASR
jgi:hypothetical protein